MLVDFHLLRILFHWCAFYPGGHEFVKRVQMGKDIKGDDYSGSSKI